MPPVDIRKVDGWVLVNSAKLNPSDESEQHLAMGTTYLCDLQGNLRRSCEFSFLLLFLLVYFVQCQPRHRVGFF